MIKILSRQRDCRGNSLVRAKITNSMDEGYLDVTYNEHLGFTLTEYEHDKKAGCISKKGTVFLGLKNVQELTDLVA